MAISQDKKAVVIDRPSLEYICSCIKLLLLQPNGDGSLDLWSNGSSLNKAHYGMFSYSVAE